MTEQVDLDALIAEAQSFVEATDNDFYENQLVKALVAELRQERERAAELEGAYNSAVERHRLAAEKRDEWEAEQGTEEPSGQIKQLLRDLIDPDDCWFDHRGGCQAHGYLSLNPGEKCPHAEAKELLASWVPAEQGDAS